MRYSMCHFRQTHESNQCVKRKQKRTSVDIAIDKHEQRALSLGEKRFVVSLVLNPKYTEIRQKFVIKICRILLSF